MENEEFPSELQDRLSNFDDALTEIENIFNGSHSIPLNEIHEKIPAIDKAKLDLVGGYAMNSLFWMYMSVTGDNPKDHGIKQELERIKGYMGRVKEIEDRSKAPKIDKEATKRFVRSALWNQAHQAAHTPRRGEKTSSTEKTDQSSSTSTPVSMDTNTNKRRSTDQPSTSSKSQTNSGKKRKKSKNKNKDKNS